MSLRAEATDAALEAAFVAIERVHGLMNAHSSFGDLARIYAEGHLRPVTVHPWTFRVLNCAQILSKASNGAFDVTSTGQSASQDDIVLLSNNQVSTRKRVRLDLSGIAKGFAVDRAVDALIAFGAAEGSVNAGGDLRVFGAAVQQVRVRIPARPELSVTVAYAKGGAFATSGSYFGGEIRDPRYTTSLDFDFSITVSAQYCMTADALTKVVAVLGPQPSLLRRFQAEAFLVSADGQVHAART